VAPRAPRQDVVIRSPTSPVHRPPGPARPRRDGL